MKRHEKELEQYMEDWKNHDEPWKLWEIRFSVYDLLSKTPWRDMTPSDTGCFGDIKVMFRRKQETIFPRGIDLPKPITEEPRQGNYCWAFTPEIPQGYMNISYNRFGDMCHWSLFQNRCLHESEENVLKWVAWWKSEVIDKCK